MTISGLLRRYAFAALLLALPALIFTVAGCRKEASGTIDPDYRAPFIVSADLAEGHADLDTSAAPIVTHNPDGSYTITDSLRATIAAPTSADEISSVSFRVLRPGSSDLLMHGTLAKRGTSGNLLYAGTPIRFAVMRDGIGAFVVQVTATGTSGNVSNTLLTTLVVTRRNARPRIFNLTAPDTLVRPLTGTRMVHIAITANDSDGLADIDKVFFRSINSTSPDFEQPLFDDGQLALDGDSVASDGRFSRLIPLDSTATTGTKEFRFFARDKSGALSDSLVHFIVINP